MCVHTLSDLPWLVICVKVKFAPYDKHVVYISSLLSFGGTTYIYMFIRKIAA